MNNNDNNSPEKEETSKDKSFFHLPQILKIDFDKPVPFKQQFAFMSTVLVISCLLFTVVYIQQMFAGNVASAEEGKTAPAAGNQTTGTTVSESSSSSAAEEKKTKKPQKKVTKISTAGADVLKKMTTVERTPDDIHKGPLVLVNKDYSSALDGENITMLSEEKSDSYVLSDYTVGVDEEIIPHLNSMLDDFASLYGETDIMIACGYRGYETQLSLYNDELNDNDTEGDQWVAPPGYSEHQTGYVFDFDLNLADGGKAGINYDGEGDYAWINNNCGEYGFILRYREGKEKITGYLFEPWHFRYVGFPHSEYIEDNDITLEEYMELLHKHNDEDAILMEDHDGHQWCIYYVEGDDYDITDVPVPVNYEYEISGDNQHGFIVTVNLNK
ncbi:MAG: M15 family metallopeptidase [Clostridia bacterium]|nr:M15 family metallopeptidase [Clostridia bacterium]